MLRKPPNQDLATKNTVKGRPITAVLDEARNKVHGVLLHAFNDKLAVVDGSFSSQGVLRQASRKLPTKNKFSKFKQTLSPRRKKDLPFNESKLDDVGDRSKECEATLAAVRDESDKLLGVGRYSHPNPWLSKIGIIVQYVHASSLFLHCCEMIY